MKANRSNFNNKLTANGHTIIYNSLTGKSLIIKNTLVGTWDELETIAATQPGLYRNLIDAGIYVDPAINETDILEKRILSGMENTEEYVLHINPTLDCNFNCWYCYENHVPFSHMNDGNVRSTEHLISNILSKDNIKRLVLSFFGGEPLLYFNKIPKRLIHHAGEICRNKGKELHISFTTNGALLNDSIIEWLSSYSCGFQITLDGGKEHHDKTRFFKGGVGSYDKIVRNIRKLAQAGMQVIVRVNFTSKNILSVWSIYDSFAGMSTDEKRHLRFDFQRVWQDWEAQNDKTEREISQIRSFFSENGFMVMTNYLLQDVRNPCYGDKRNHALINYNGDVFGCTARDFTSSNRIGILDENGNIQYDKDKYQNWRNSKFSKKICKTCRIAPLCGGGCMQKAYEHRDSPDCTLGYSEDDKDKMIISLLDYLISSNSTSLKSIAL